MQFSLRNETLESIKQATEQVLRYQEVGDSERLLDQLDKATLNEENIGATVAVFSVKETKRPFEVSSPLPVEARLCDQAGNPLHAIVYLDRDRNLLSLEVFAWDKWECRIDVVSMAPALYDTEGLSAP